MTDILHRRARRQNRETWLAWACAILLILAGVGVMGMGGTEAKPVAPSAPAPSAAAPAEARPGPARAVRVIAIRGAAPAPAVTTR